jgi:hypothetical protein
LRDERWAIEVAVGTNGGHTWDGTEFVDNHSLPIDVFVAEQP